ncbi:MAG: hypothetical protein Q4G46_01305 [Propionibacteriaceae bacterium]|nr:hypothetical protein [Propionibacteriaceae bacterium]
MSERRADPGDESSVAGGSRPEPGPRRGRWAAVPAPGSPGPGADTRAGDDPPADTTTADDTTADDTTAQSTKGDTMTTARSGTATSSRTGEAAERTRTAREQTPFARPQQARPEPRVVENSGTLTDQEPRRSAGELISQLTPDTPQKATSGWRSWFGLKPSQRELDEFRDLSTVKTLFHRPVTVMVANPKGGSGKTPTSVLLSGAFGLNRGGGVVAWDNNELRGTMPDRTTSPHRRSVHDMLAKLEELRWSTSQFTDLAYFLNHQDTGNFYTLGSAQHAGHVVTGQNFRQVHELFARYFQVIVVDTGNNEAAPNWAAAAAQADCLVVPTKWRKDSLIPAARMLESLQDTNPALLERTVIAATNGPQDSQQVVKDNGASWFGSSHPIVEIPTDPHIAEGGVIDFGRLHKNTRRAALRLAAEVSVRLISAGLTQE